MPDQNDVALTAIELFKTVVTFLGKSAPADEESLLRLYDKCLQHVGYSNLNRQNDFSRSNTPKKGE